MKKMNWVLAEPDAVAATLLSEQASLHPLIAKLLVNRGIIDPAEALAFLACDLSSLSSPGIFLQMEKAVTRIQAAISAQENISVYGDYDVDGVTGASVLYLVLKQLGAKVACYIPDRMTEGYGLNAEALGTLKRSGVKLVISVDCGITALKEAEIAGSLGLDLIITDHHEFEQRGGSGDASAPNLPRAYAVLHPGLIKPDVPLVQREFVQGLTGVGMAFKLVQALLGGRADDERLISCLDLVTLGTIADVGRITGENRVLVKHGLARMSADAVVQRPGIEALIQVSRLSGKNIGVGTVGFSLAPRINASGRLKRADSAFRLLTTASPDEARELAEELDAINRERQSVEEGIWVEARKLCGQFDTAAAGALVLASEGWHAGVIGIVASRIVEEFYRPTALISIRDGVGKGSARSISGFDLYEGLAVCSDLLLGFGGHKYAAGFTIAQENIPALRERLSSIVMERMGPRGFIRSLNVDSAVSLDELTLELMQEMEQIAPFGQGNPEPRLGSRGLQVVSSRIVGNNHLKMKLKQAQGPVLDAIAFNQGPLLGNLAKSSACLAAVFTPRLNVWNGSTKVELDIRDIKTDKGNAK